MARTEGDIVIGNVYKKYATKNPLSRYLMDRYHRSLDQLVSSIDPDKIHEVGCGEGNLISRYANGKRELIASDFSHKIIEEAQRSYSTLGILFKVASIYDLASKDSATCILCCEVLEHLDSPEKALDVLANIADPYLIISVPREPIWRMLNIMRGAYIKKLGNTPGHIQHWSKTKFLRLLETKFQILKIYSPFPWTMVLCQRKEININRKGGST